MTHPREPLAGELTDVLDLDRSIEAVRLGLATSDDPLLALLIEARDTVDDRAVRLATDPPPGRVRPEAAARTRRRRRLAVLPAAALIVLGSTGAAAALSGSPQAPLYPLHRLLFGAPTAADSQLTRDLAAAGHLLDAAAEQSSSTRRVTLQRVDGLLMSAQLVLPQADPSRRAAFAGQIAAAEARARHLAAPSPAAPSPAIPSPAAVAPSPLPAHPDSGDAPDENPRTPAGAVPETPDQQPQQPAGESESAAPAAPDTAPRPAEQPATGSDTGGASTATAPSGQSGESDQSRARTSPAGQSRDD